MGAQVHYLFALDLTEPTDIRNALLVTATSTMAAPFENRSSSGSFGRKKKSDFVFPSQRRNGDSCHCHNAMGSY
jgi:hypothetical protein